MKSLEYSLDASANTNEVDSDIPHVVRMHDIVVADEYATDQALFEVVNRKIDAISQLGYYGDPSADIARIGRNKIDYQNPATQKLMSDLPSSGAWLRHVPTAKALDPLYSPEKKELLDGTVIDPELATWMRYIADARGIRSRGRVVQGLLEQTTQEHDSASVRWLSLASGAAQPVIEAAANVRNETGHAPDVILVDIDRSVLDLALEYASQSGVKNSFEARRENILRPEGIASERLLPGSYDAVEAVGIVEYLKVNGPLDGEKSKLADAETFLRNAFELVGPGGTFVFGNMLDTHPQLGFTLNVIQWPHIQPRSVDEVVRIIESAGIQEDIDVYLPDDGVYAIYSIRKAGGE